VTCEGRQNATEVNEVGSSRARVQIVSDGDEATDMSLVEQSAW
jgi:hypothetical protein